MQQKSEGRRSNPGRMHRGLYLCISSTTQYNVPKPPVLIQCWDLRSCSFVISYPMIEQLGHFGIWLDHCNTVDILFFSRYVYDLLICFVSVELLIILNTQSPTC